MFAPKRVSQGVACAVSKFFGSQLVPGRFIRTAALSLAGLLTALLLASVALAQTNAYALLQQQSSKFAGGSAASQKGTSVAISADGLTAVIGSPGDNGGVGGAQVYVWDPFDALWNPQGAELVGTGSSGAPLQGVAVAISGDGNTILVGGFHDFVAANFKGATWVFTRSAGVWSQQGEKLVGTGGIAGDEQGGSIALSADGNTALIGGTGGESHPGRVWAFTRSAGVWSQGSSATPSDESNASAFGSSVSLSADGKTALIGGSGDSTGDFGHQGAAWIYSISSGTLAETVKLVGTGITGNAAFQGAAVALSGDGTVAAVGGPADNSLHGAVWIYTLTSGTWSQKAKPVPSDEAAGDSAFGTSVALSRDGSVLFAGGPDDNTCFGAVWMFARTSLTAWTEEGAKIVPSDAAVGGGSIGSSVSLSADGNSAFLGGDQDNSGAGAAWPYSTNISFPTTGTASSSVTETIAIQPENTFTLGSISVVTQGSQNLDFTEPSQSEGACFSGEDFDGTVSCSITVQFLLTAPGMRLGAILFYDMSNALQATVYLDGIADQPQLAFLNRTINTTAGTPQTPGFTGDGMTPTSAELDSPYGEVFDGAGNYYIADPQNHRMRGVNTFGGSATLYNVSVLANTIQTVAGDGTDGGTADNGDGGQAVDAELGFPQAPAIDGAGNLYIADYHVNVVRKVDPVSGVITTFAGGSDNGALNGLATNFGLGALSGGTAAVATGRNGDIYIADIELNAVYRVSAQTGIITALAGTGTRGFSGDGGPATSARLSGPLALAIDSNENVYLSDDGNNVIREVAYGTGTITTVAGVQSDGGGFSGDGGLATAADLCDAEGLAVDAAGNLYISDSSNNVIREVFAATGIIQTMAGSITNASGFSGDTGAALNALLNYPVYPVLDALGNIWFSDDGNQVIRELSGGATLNFGNVGVSSTSAAQDVIVTNTGNQALFIASVDVSSGFDVNGTDTTCVNLTLFPGQSCILGVEFSPTTTGPANGSVTVGTKAAGMISFEVMGTAITGTATSLTALPNPANIGDTVTFSASVFPIPDAGSINFLDGSTSLGMVSVDGSGDAVLMTSPLTQGTHSITAAYGGDSSFGSSTSSATMEVIDAPAPTLSSILPTSASVGGAGFTLAVTGTGFVSSAVVQWNGTALTTTFVSATSMTATVPAGDIASTGSASVTVFSPTPGGGTSAAQTFTIGATNPSPTLTSIAPTSATAGGAGFTITITGTNFVAGSVVKWNGTALTTTLVSSTSLTASVPGADIATVGTASVTVFNPTPGGGTSSAQTFTITAGNPLPTLTSIAPTSAATGGAAFTITLTGTGFVSTTIVQWNGTALVTTFVSATSITAAVPASDLAAGGTASVTAFSPTPGGGTSSTQTFTINNPVPTLTLTVSPSPANFGQSVTLTLTLAPAPTGSSLGTVTFLNGSTTLGTATPNASGAATFSLTTLPVGALSLTASYSGNATLATAASTSTSLTVNTNYQVTAPQTPYSAPQGGDVLVPIAVPPFGGAFNGLVTMYATGLPAGATATFNPAQVMPGANGATTMLSIQLAPLAAGIPRRGPLPFTPVPPLAAGAGLLIFLRRKRLRGVLRIAAISVALFLIGTAMLGCSGGFLQPPSTTPGSFTINVIGTSGSLSHSTAVTVVVQ